MACALERKEKKKFIACQTEAASSRDCALQALTSPRGLLHPHWCISPASGMSLRRRSWVLLCGTALLLLCWLAQGFLRRSADVGVGSVPREFMPSPSGLHHIITGTRGESVFFPADPYQKNCERSFLGSQKINRKGKDILYSDGTCDDVVFAEYKDRIKPSCNGSFLLTNVLIEDEGWYSSRIDIEETVYYYLHVLEPVCNVSIVSIPSEHDMLMHCNITGNADTVVWTHDGKTLPKSQIMPGNVSLRIPSGEAYGLFQCTVQCGVIGQQHATINLTVPEVRWEIYVTILILEVDLPCLFILLLQFSLDVRSRVKKMAKNSHSEVRVENETQTGSRGNQCWDIVNVTVLIWRLVAVFGSIGCFFGLSIERDRNGKDLAMPGLGIVLLLTLVIEGVLEWTPKKVHKCIKPAALYKVIDFIICLSQHICIIYGASRLLTDCLNMRCLHMRHMAKSIVLIAIIVPICLILLTILCAYIYIRITGKQSRHRSSGSSNDALESKGILLVTRDTSKGEMTKHIDSCH